MRIISKILIGLGLIVTIAANLITYYGIRTAVNGMLNSAENGIGIVAWGMDSAYFYSLVGVTGCFIMIIGFALSALSMKPVTAG